MRKAPFLFLLLLKIRVASALRLSTALSPWRLPTLLGSHSQKQISEGDALDAKETFPEIDSEYYSNVLMDPLPLYDVGYHGGTTGVNADGSARGGTDGSRNGDDQPQSEESITITRFLHDAVQSNNDLGDLEGLLLAIQMACKTIASLVNRAGLDREHSTPNDVNDGRFYSMKRLDTLSTIVLKNALKYTGKCQVVAPKSKLDSESPAEHQPGVLIAKSMDDSTSNYVACLDPLDGSGNADASICTGTVFGVFNNDDNSNEKGDNNRKGRRNKSADALTQELVDSVLHKSPAKYMRAAGYCLYSSATVLVFTLGDGKVQGFTLDPQRQEFVLTHPNWTIPQRGTVYSCNEANSEGWDEDNPYKKYLKNIKMGKGQTGKRYAHRYVGSMVGDIHRTLLYGGIFAYPADSIDHPDGNLQLLYKTAPMAYIVHTAGGKAIDGRTSGSLLNIAPARVHQKTPCFIGSADDVSEFESYLPDRLLNPK